MVRTGAAQGISRAIAARLASESCRVVVAEIDVAKLAGKALGILEHAGPPTPEQVAASETTDDERFLVLPLDDAFDAVVISGEAGPSKPDASIYDLALHRVAVAPAATAFVDDDMANVHGARAVGMQGFQRTDQADTWAAPTQLIPARACARSGR
ncbi:HAD-IA family hydrolase [Saccharopolyspora spinosa]|uniref:HAD-IA family hydrolase n=1 Tax=Saccharopolyspora spinosa TaxID=60894 RepID=UPI0002E24358|nr:HAD-IA family hydrolase [Saccharopolyspora spinosa]